ncbi:MAG TPA: hypothetical protein VEX43_17175 [Chthoniobacterales bacterium]|nr:hypothetical protein [Chthoniobacterales bacterium]
MQPFNLPRLLPKWILYLVVAAVPILGLTARLTERLAYTGDEPRYLLYALSLKVEGKPLMSEDGYEKLRHERLPGFELAAQPLNDVQPDPDKPVHSIVWSLLLSPFVTGLSLAQIRLISLMTGLVGLCFLAKLLIAQKLPITSALGCLIPAALFFPMFPYYFLALPEAILFLLVCIAFWNLIGTGTERLRDFAPSIICSCLAPLVHLRALPLLVAVSLYLFLKLGWRRKPGTSGIIVVKVTGIYLAAVTAVILYNCLIYGSMLGSVTSGRPTFSLGGIIAALLNSHFGLLPYAPIFLLSFVGLIEGLWQRREWSVPASAFLVTLVTTTVGENPGETFPARFWVIGVPVLAICLIGFFQGRMLTLGKAILYALLGLVSLANTVMLIIDPGLHLAARSGPFPYDRLFEIVPWIHLGFWLGLFGDTDYLLKAAGACAVWVAMAAAATIYRSRILTAVAVLLLLLGFEIHRASRVRYSARLDPGSLAVVVEDRAIMQRAPLRLTLRASSQSDFPKHSIIVTDGSKHWEQKSTNSVLLRPNEPWKVPLSLRVSWERDRPGVADADAVGVALCGSWLVRLWADEPL